MPALTPLNDEIRAQNVSASEVGALMGPHPYTTPEQIWDRLMERGPIVDALLLEGKVSPEFAFRRSGPVRPTTEAMLNGSFLEPAIAQLASKRLGLRLRASSKTYTHPLVRLCATPDYLVLGTPPGLVEIKLSGSRDMWSRIEPPEHVEWQVRAQMACTRRETAAICVLIGTGLRTYLLERERDKEDLMLAKVDQFWREHIVTGVRPEPSLSIPVEYREA